MSKDSRGCPEQREMMSGDSVEALQARIAKLRGALTKLKNGPGNNPVNWPLTWASLFAEQALAEDSSFERSEKQEKEV